MLASATIPTTPSRLGDDWHQCRLQAMIGGNVVSSPSGTVIGESHLLRPGYGRAYQVGACLRPLPDGALGGSLERAQCVPYPGVATVTRR